MSQQSNHDKSAESRLLAVPTLLTVPDLNQVPGGDAVHTSIADQLPATASALQYSEDAFASDEASSANARSDQFDSSTDFEKTTVGSSVVSEMPSLDDLSAAADLPHVENASTGSVSVADAQVPSDSTWFTGNLRKDVVTMGTIALTFIACALVAQAMRQDKSSDTFNPPSRVAIANEPVSPPVAGRSRESAHNETRRPSVQQTFGQQPVAANSSQPFSQQPVASNNMQPFSQQPRMGAQAMGNGTAGESRFNDLQPRQQNSIGDRPPSASQSLSINPPAQSPPRSIARGQTGTADPWQQQTLNTETRAAFPGNSESVPPQLSPPATSGNRNNPFDQPIQLGPRETNYGNQAESQVDPRSSALAPGQGRLSRNGISQEPKAANPPGNSGRYPRTNSGLILPGRGQIGAPSTQSRFGVADQRAAATQVDRFGNQSNINDTYNRDANFSNGMNR